MEKISLSEKIAVKNELKNFIYKSSEIDRVQKFNFERELNSRLEKATTKEEIEKLKDEMLVRLKVKKEEVVKEVVTDIKDVNKIQQGNIQSVNTLKREDGTVITSIKSDKGISVKDSSYSGNIDEVVREVAQTNPDIEKDELTFKAFEEMQRRQIDIPVYDVGKSSYNSKTQNQISSLPGDNKRINDEYKILVDEKNRIIDLNEKKYKDASDDLVSNNMTNVDDSVSEDLTINKTNTETKAKVYTKKLPGFKMNDAAFVDAMLLGSITFYTGILGLCAILSRM